MTKKQITASEIGRKGGRIRATQHSKSELSEWAKLGGRPPKLDDRTLAHVEAWLQQGKSQSDCAKAVGVSVRTIGRALARQRRGEQQRGLIKPLAVARYGV
jgi:hypothetical protein